MEELLFVLVVLLFVLNARVYCRIIVFIRHREALLFFKAARKARDQLCYPLPVLKYSSPPGLPRVHTSQTFLGVRCFAMQALLQMTRSHPTLLTLLRGINEVHVNAGLLQACAALCREEAQIFSEFSALSADSSKFTSVLCATFERGFCLGKGSSARITFSFKRLVLPRPNVSTASPEILLIN